MVKLQNRSYKKELLDQDNIPFKDIKQNMLELNKVNSLLGGHSITLKGLQSLIANRRKDDPLLICEIGCGGGDNLKAISDYCNQRNIPARFIGIDLKKECIEFAKEQYPDLKSCWINSDYAKADLGDDIPDIIFSSLFCHHFTDDQLVMQLQWMKENSMVGFFINDLHRNIIAYYSIKWITAVVSKSYLVKNDAPLSVSRSFRKDDWISICERAHLNGIKIKWKWAFRYLLTYTHE